MVLVFHPRRDSVLRAEVSHEDRDDQRIGLVTGHLHETCGRDGRLRVVQVAEVLRLEQTARVRAGDPRRIAAPGAGSGECLELRVNTLKILASTPYQPVMNNSLHVRD